MGSLNPGEAEEADSGRLTARQRQVLELIGRGYSNAEIAARLGISLDGAKWHVREILGRLQLETREEAATYWRDHNRGPVRLFRAMRALVSVPVLKFPAGSAVTASVAVVGAGAVLLTVAAVAVVAFQEPGDSGSAVAEAGSEVPADDRTPTTTVDAQALATPASTTVVSPTARSLAELVAAPADTSGWRLHVSPSVGLSLRVPPEFEVTERKWGPFIDSDREPPTELSVVKHPFPPELPRPPHTPPPDGTVIFYAVILHFEVGFGEPPEIILDATRLTVLGDEIQVRKAVYDDRTTKVVAQKNIGTHRGILLVSAMVIGEDEEDILLLIGMLKSLEVLP